MIKKILLVDDERDLADMLKIRLEADNYEVVIAVNGKEALEKARNNKPDLILLDVVIPEMDGYQVLAELLKDEVLKTIPVMMLSVRDQTGDIQKAARAGAIDYTIKPFHVETLLKKIRRILGE